MRLIVVEYSDIGSTRFTSELDTYDVISHKMLKHCPNNIALHLQIIFNKSLQ